MVSKDPLMIIEALWNFGSPIKSACNKMFCSVFRRWCDGWLAGADLLAGGGQHQPPVEHPRHPAGLHRPVEVSMILMTTYEFWCHVLFSSWLKPVTVEDFRGLWISCVLLMSVEIIRAIKLRKCLAITATIDHELWQLLIFSHILFLTPLCV